jgi:hypothetical protein
VTWTFHNGERAEMNFEHREAELVRRLVVLRERHAFFPNEVSERQVSELARKLDELRAQIDSITQ